MDWSAITRAEWISGVSALISLVAASYTWRNFRLAARKEQREINATKPIVEHYIESYGDLPDEFVGVRLVVRNRASHAMLIESIASAHPKRLRIFNHDLLPIVDDRTGRRDSGDEAYRLASAASVPIDIHIDPNSVGSFSALVRLLEPTEKAMLRIDVSERLAEIRRLQITVTITLPDEAIKAAKTLLSADRLKAPLHSAAAAAAPDVADRRS
ncbi:hypothetical protein [Bosea sp. (in: a-proteobacteria)]|uniref:hypothetical protein n=1 Tax=Bosea sp. (in: a-proteobacteria) TaxID=1871050 RepID=UPI0026042D82|nr:hypothetical protein [Bosea sp. (in: a-proteobacteria)]MCO5092710.1 hypothetical protein [Bosea sp. (in: a-proteobacteria)]